MLLQNSQSLPCLLGKGNGNPMLSFFSKPFFTAHLQNRLAYSPFWGYAFLRTYQPLLMAGNSLRPLTPPGSSLYLRVQCNIRTELGLRKYYWNRSPVDLTSSWLCNRMSVELKHIFSTYLIFFLVGLCFWVKYIIYTEEYKKYTWRLVNDSKLETMYQPPRLRTWPVP